MQAPSTPERQLKAALEKLNKCGEFEVPDEFKAMPPELKMNEDVVKMAIDKCFAGSFGKESKLPELFKAMPAEVQRNEAVVKMAFEVQRKCDNAFVPDLFKAMPDEVKTKEAIVKIALEKCTDPTIPWLFWAIPDEVKTKEAIVKIALEKCFNYNIPELFKNIPYELKTKEAVVKMAFDKCFNGKVPELFMAMPDKVKTKEAVVKMAFDKCYNDDIPRLFKAMPDEVKTKEAIVKIALEKCTDPTIPWLFWAIPDEVKANDAVVKTAFDKCDFEKVPELFKAMPAEVKTKDYVVKMSIQKCSDNELPKLFEAILDQVHATPAELKQLKEYFLLAVDGMDALSANALRDFEDFQTRLPAELPHDKDIQSAFERKKVMELPFHKKYQKLLRAAVEVSITYLLVLGSIEGAIWFQRRAGGKIANLSNQHWQNKTDFEEVHFEIFDGCVLSAAPQPFDIALPLTSLKLVIITAAFGFISRDLMSVKDKREKRWKVWISVGMVVYSLIMIPISFISLVRHYFWEVSPQIQGSPKKYECFFALINLAPFQTNYLMYLVQFLAGVVVYHSAGLDMYEVDPQLQPDGLKSYVHRVAEHVSRKLGVAERADFGVWLYMHNVVEYLSRKIQACFSRKFPGVAKETLVQPLLDDDTTIGSMQKFKSMGKFMLFSLTLAPYLCVETPFVITHKIPAAACFFPFIILIITVTGCIFAIVNRDLLRKLRILRGRDRIQYFDSWLKAVEEAGYMPIVPALWGVLVINEFLTLAPIYWYGGAGWFESGVMVLVERSLWIYFNVFWIRIIAKFWSGISFLNEIT